MQGWTGCSSLTTGSTTTVTLTDTRDNNKYKVARLKDGKCWMVENLRIAGKTVSSTDSDMSSGSISIPNAASGFIGTNNNAGYYYSAQNSGYYSWYTATAGKGTSSVSSGNVSSSICPKGWRLPTGGSNGEFQTLYNQYSSSANLRATPVPGFVISGKYNNSSFVSSSYGFWWASTAYNSNDAYRMYMNSSSVGPTGNYNKSTGYSVRCIAKQ